MNPTPFWTYRILTALTLAGLLVACGKKDDQAASANVTQSGPPAVSPTASVTATDTAAADSAMNGLKATASACRSSLTGESPLLTYLLLHYYTGFSGINYPDLWLASGQNTTTARSHIKSRAFLRDSRSATCSDSLSSSLAALAGLSPSYNPTDIQDFIGDTALWAFRPNALQQLYTGFGTANVTPLANGQYSVALAGPGGTANSSTVNQTTINNTTVNNNNTVNNNTTITGNNNNVTNTTPTTVSISAGDKCTDHAGQEACAQTTRVFRQARAHVRAQRQQLVLEMLGAIGY